MSFLRFNRTGRVNSPLYQLFVFLGVTVLLISGISLLGATAGSSGSNALDKTGVHTNATVSKVVVSYATGPANTKRIKVYQPEATFTIDSGASVTHDFASVYNGVNDWKVEQSLPIAYDKANPQNATIVGPKAEQQHTRQLTVTIITFILAVIIFVTARVFYVRRKRNLNAAQQNSNSF